jgi:hypothetical protein
MVMVLPSRDLVVVRLGMTQHYDWGIEQGLAALLEALPQ